jgi:hypothetical protein
MNRANGTITVTARMTNQILDWGCGMPYGLEKRQPAVNLDRIEVEFLVFVDAANLVACVVFFSVRTNHALNCLA